MSQTTTAKTLALAVVFGLLGAWLYESGNDWLANFCVIPPSAYGLYQIIQGDAS